jgi:hypothetical protein
MSACCACYPVKQLAEHNRAPKPFVWTQDPGEIIAAVKGGHH